MKKSDHSTPVDSATFDMKGKGRRYLTVTGLLILLILPGCASMAPASRQAQNDRRGGKSRNWNKCPAIRVVEPQGDIMVVGDAHGDYERLQTLLVAAEVITFNDGPPDPKKAKWDAGDATLVVVGDFISKYYHALDIIALLKRLQEQTSPEQVIVTMGNHEAEFMSDPDVSKAKLFKKELEGAGLTPDGVVVRKDSAGIGIFLDCLPLAAKVGDWFFSHAGDTKGDSLRSLRLKIENQVSDRGYAEADVLFDKKTGLLNARLKKNVGEGAPEQWWNRKGDDKNGDGKGVKRLEGFIKALGARHMVIGHQASTYRFEGPKGDKKRIKRKKGHMFQLYNGLFFLVDVGMTQKDQSEGALMRIENDNGSENVSVICPDGSTHMLWPDGLSEGIRCTD